MDFGFLSQVAAESGASEELVAEIRNANTASQVGDMMNALEDKAFFQKLCDYCCQESLKQVEGGMEIETVIISMKAELLGKAYIQG